MAIEQHKDDENFPYWRVIDEKHPVVKKAKLDGNQIKKRRVDEEYGKKTHTIHKSFTVEVNIEIIQSNFRKVGLMGFFSIFPSILNASIY